MSRSNNTTRTAFTGSKNETGGTPDALERVWIRVVHRPRPQLRGGCCWRRFLCDGCARMCADNDAVRAACSHTAVAAFLYFRTDKR